MTAKTDSKAWKESWETRCREAKESLAGHATLEALEALRLKYLGRKGSLTELLKTLKDLPLEARRELGGPANAQKEEILGLIEASRGSLEHQSREREIAGTRLDPTLPGVPSPQGYRHPLTQIIAETADILGRLGFSWAEGPLIETNYYNFEALNIPAHHPARDMFDTFYLKLAPKSPEAAGEHGNLLLRTHTSPVQIRRMESARPPLRIISPGRVFRHEAVDATHSAVFHQVEGLYVDHHVTLADLKGTLHAFMQALFGPKTRTRFRPSFFPFTEPSAEMDVQCLFCSGSGCGLCKRSGWLEILGAGLVHPNVFKAVDYDPEAWSGFAFGLGIERVAMLRWGIPDIRMFYQNDIRFLEQFP
ncbi:MAG: phenylalanine--tRNA ligase subunit alpha [Elusimicrobia bacterium]|nr:phenylalanine--tRNA ligase subunit alpha [Elusimicrobiota bacterium]